MPPSAIEIISPSVEWDGTWKQSYTKSAHIEDSNSNFTAEPEPILTIDDLLRRRAHEAPHETIISYPSSGNDYVSYTYQQIDVFAQRVAQKYRDIIPQRLSSSDSEIVVGLLGPSNFEYFISVLALSKLSASVLFLSTRISVAAYSSLLKATGAKHLLINSTFNDVAQEVKGTCEIPDLQVHNIATSESYDFAINQCVDTRMSTHLDPEIETKKISWIIHSSGSTGLPKPIYQTHKAALNNYANNLNMRGFITLPLYHAHGISSVFRSIHSRKQIYLYNADLPLTQQNLLSTMQKYSFEIFYGVPYALKLLGDSSEGTAALAKLKIVMFGGSACPDALGDKLVENGVNLISHYGTTETGQLMTSFRDSGDIAWDYVRAGDAVKPYLRWELRSPGIYELIVLDGWSSKVASNRPDNSYATKDLFTAHPTIPDAWKYFARLDDTIVLMNGEKVVPNMFEHLIRASSAIIAEAVMFGNGKTRPGLMVISSESGADLSNDDFRNALVPALTEANKDMPGYAQMSLDMVEILPYGTSYPRTDKGTVIRAAFYRTFSEQIERVYAAADVPSGELCLSEEELKTYIRTELLRILRTNTIIKDETDLFSIGLDSLQSIQLRSVLSKNIQTNKQQLGANIVFDFPSINALSKELYRMRIGGESEVISVTDKMNNLIQKYSSFSPHVPTINDKEGEYLVVTGATGSLGAHLVARLVTRLDVKRVYCLVRASSPLNARSRVRNSLRKRYVYHNLDVESRRKIVALPADFSDESLGLSPEKYTELTSNITGLIHCAWSVNFNLALGSFEADCISGAHNLMALCLKAHRPEPATFNFCSSVSTVARTKGGFVREDLPESLEYAQGMGYAQSKLVTEHICVAAAKSYGIRARVLRIGQVIADTAHGIWNATEAIPLMIQSALTIGAIPKLDENPLWLPVDVVAAAVLDISLSSAGTCVTNIVNHQSFHWTQDLIPALHKAGLSFKEIHQRDWVNALRTSNSDPVSNPPIKLVDFFASKYDNDVVKSGLTYDTSFARYLSPALAAAPVLNQELVSKFVSHFLATSWAVRASQSKKRLIVLAGPCGTGKSTVAASLSKALGISWIEGDHLHSRMSIDKMSNGVALSDNDRWAWLETLKATALLDFNKNDSEQVIVTCSALKRIYRDEVRNSRVMKPVFLMLQCDDQTLERRVSEREGHYMGVQMIGSQLQSLELPWIDEVDVIPVDTIGSQEDVLAEVLDVLENL